jgi:hypothetical protein
MNNQNSILNIEAAKIAASAAAAFTIVALLAMIALAILWTTPATIRNRAANRGGELSFRERRFAKSGGPAPPVPNLTFHSRIKLNARVSLRRYAEALSVIASDIALVRVQRGAAVGRSYSARRLRSQLGWF